MSSPQHHQLATLSHDAIVDILLFCTNDLKSVMNFASTCSEFQKLITTDCSERFWLAVLMKLCDDDELKQSKGLKSSTLSILNTNTPNNNTKIFIKIVKTQTRYRRRHDIMNQYSQRRMMDKFRFVANLKVTDPLVNNLIASMISDSLKYSPTNMIKCLYGNSPITFISKAHQNSYLTPKDLIDALFQKENAHLELDIKNRTMSSCLYDYWKNQEGKSSTDTSYHLYYFRHYYTYNHCNTIDNTLLFLKLLYLEFPNKEQLNDTVMKTGYELEKESKGIFKNQLNFLKTFHPQNNVFKTGLLVFEKLLYD